VDGQRRLIAVVMGADSPKGREQQAAKLLHWGQQNFDTVQVLQKGRRSAPSASGTAIKSRLSSAPIRISG
jgi:D-alanyl-D-alanine carboxypeptidase